MALLHGLRIFFSKLGKLLGGRGHPPTAIYVAEHAEADWTSMLCGGAVVRAWKEDHSGLNEVSVEEVHRGGDHRSRLVSTYGRPLEGGLRYPFLYADRVVEHRLTGHYRIALDCLRHEEVEKCARS